MNGWSDAEGRIREGKSEMQACHRARNAGEWEPPQGPGGEAGGREAQCAQKVGGGVGDGGGGCGSSSGLFLVSKRRFLLDRGSGMGWHGLWGGGPPTGE